MERKFQELLNAIKDKGISDAIELLDENIACYSSLALPTVWKDITNFISLLPQAFLDQISQHAANESFGETFKVSGDDNNAFLYRFIKNISPSRVVISFGPAEQNTNLRKKSTSLSVSINALDNTSEQFRNQKLVTYSETSEAGLYENNSKESSIISLTTENGKPVFKTQAVKESSYTYTSEVVNFDAIANGM